jgi:cysteine protease ATG4
MMLANAFLLHFLGSEWLTLMESPKVIESTRKILKWFGDSRTAPYSIHAIATVGDKQFGKPIGDWHGPATIAHILSLLALQHQPDNNMIRLHVAQDGVLAKQAIYPSKATEKEAEDHVDDAGECDEDYATIILVPLRLGVDKLNHVYSSALLDLFALPEFLGFIGGRPSASYYFMGCQVPTQKHHLPHQSSSSAPSAQAEANSNNSTPANFAPQVLYLDPHTTQPFHNFHPDPQSVLVAAGTTGGRGGGGGNGAEAGFHSYRFPTVYRMPLSQIDPSLTLGFYTRNRAEFHNLCDKLEPIMKAESPLFVITEQMLSHNSTTNPDALDDDDMLNFDLGDDFDMNDC